MITYRLTDNETQELKEQCLNGYTFLIYVNHLFRWFACKWDEDTENLILHGLRNRFEDLPEYNNYGNEITMEEIFDLPEYTLEDLKDKHKEAIENILNSNKKD